MVGIDVTFQALLPCGVLPKGHAIFLSDRGEKYIKIAEGIDAGDLALFGILPHIHLVGKIHSVGIGSQPEIIVLQF